MPRIHLLPLLATLVAGCAVSSPETPPCQPPEGFSESDLVGTWVSRQNVRLRSDTLEIRQDGTYKQTIDLEIPKYHFQGEWEPWRLEYAENGVVYLHLTGMRLYAFNPDLIDLGVVGGGDGMFVDFCLGPVVMEDGTNVYPGVRMPAGEGVLTVRRDRSILGRAPQGIYLQVLPVTDVSAWTYELASP